MFNLLKNKIDFIKEKDKEFIRYKRVQIFIVIVISLFVSLIFFFSPLYERFDKQIYDVYMRNFRKEIKIDQRLVLIDIDDNTMNQDFIGYSWPWPRYIFGDAIEVLAEVGAKAVVFDIEFLGKSAAGINKELVDKSRLEIVNTFNNIMSDYEKTLNVLKKNPSLLTNSNILLTSFENNINIYYLNIDNLINNMVMDNDLYFAKRLQYFGKAYGTVNILQVDGYSEDINSEEYKRTLQNLKKFGYPVEKYFSGDNYKKHKGIVSKNVCEFPAQIITDQYKNVGFTAVSRDKDSLTRSINLFFEKNGYLIPQLSLPPLFELLEIEDIDFSKKDKIILKNAKIDGKKENITIPIYNKGILINWPKGEFNQIFTIKNKNSPNYGSHFSFARLIYYKYVLLKEFEKNLNNLNNIEDEKIKDLIEKYRKIEMSKKIMIDSGITLTENDRKSLNEFMELILNQIASLTSQENLEIVLKEIPDNKITLKETIKTIYENCNYLSNEVLRFKKELEEDLKDKICFIGLTATGTQDIGANPFDNTFENVGTHPAVFNTIINKQFINIFPKWIIFIVMIFITIFFVITFNGKKAIFTAIGGILSIVFIIVFTIPFYYFLSLFISPVLPFFYMFVAFLLVITINFFISEMDKQLIRNTFDKYLSPDVINSLIKDNKKIELGGEKKNCTAMFTDIESFSSFSERFMDNPKGLVSLLNSYLSRMSDIIIDNGGIIDKYEGDAIIAMFGAPKETEQHPYNACLAAIRMKQAEKEVNKLLLETNQIDRPLYTRIGINTGDMFIGNMGTTKRLDYTMIGHHVNLASRLEGVNKQYGTYILVSEMTYSRVYNEFIFRKLDRVRVVNINTPIRLYELIGVKGEVPDEIINYIDKFEIGLEKFENKNYKEALNIFYDLQKEPYYQKTINIYIERCKKFIENPPPDIWDGVYNLSEK